MTKIVHEEHNPETTESPVPVPDPHVLGRIIEQFESSHGANIFDLRETIRLILEYLKAH